MDEQFSPHFRRSEFERDGAMPEAAASAYRILCPQILEPIRTQAGGELEITSGYRSPLSNAEAHGVKNSQHMATEYCCAADFAVPGVKDLRPVFDWIRLESGLPFDQVVLEHGDNCDVIHISWAKAYQRREALEGATHNRTAYDHWPSNPPSANS